MPLSTTSDSRGGENLRQIRRGNNGISRDLALRIHEHFLQYGTGRILTGENDRPGVLCAPYPGWLWKTPPGQTAGRGFPSERSDGYFTPNILSFSENASYSARSEAIRSLTDWIFSARQAFEPQKA